MSLKAFLPIAIDVSDKLIVIVGGGHVALQKLQVITQFAQKIRVIAPEIKDEIRALPVCCILKRYEPTDVKNAFLVYACTHDRALNKIICSHAHHEGALVNVADDPQNCDFVSPALFQSNEMSVAVTSNGTNAKQSVHWQNAIKDFIINDLLHR